MQIYIYIFTILHIAIYKWGREDQLRKGRSESWEAGVGQEPESRPGHVTHSSPTTHQTHQQSVVVSTS